MALLLEPAALVGESLAVFSAWPSGVWPVAEGKVLPAVCVMASTLPEATIASMSMNASADSASATTAPTTATRAALAARRVPSESQLACSTSTDTHSTRSILLACGATAAA
eukprot:167087-Rhodomonas_salina.1